MLSAFHIKLIAITVMLIDHVGFMFFPQTTILRLVGRLAFPLFAWLVANGARHTKDIKKYMMRLLGFALISQAPFMLFLRAAGVPYMHLNIFFTLSAGLLAIFAIENTKNIVLKYIFVLGIALLALLLRANYGFLGVFSIVCFYIFASNIPKMFWSQLILFSTCTIFFKLFFVSASNPNTLMFYKDVPLQVSAVLSVLIIALYNNKQGPRLQYFFYFFYPIHLLVLYALRLNL